MDFKEKYQEALERAKKGLPIDEVFPELKESEDERIRKFLVELVSNDKANNYNGLYEDRGVRFDDVLAYLEKQKEQKTLILDGEIEDRKRDIVAAIRECYPADYAEYLTSFLKGLSPEDNSDDEYGQEMLGIAYKLMYEHIPENLRTQEFWDSLKFMREYTGRVAIIHSYQKPAGWSDEDEKMLVSFLHKVEVCNLLTNKESAWIVKRLKSLRSQPKAELTLLDKNIINAAVAFVEQNDHFNCWGGIDKHTVIKALRSLKPHWKPSEEQMSALEYFIRSWGESGTMSPQNPTLCAAKTLLNDLKKL